MRSMRNLFAAIFCSACLATLLSGAAQAQILPFNSDLNRINDSIINGRGFGQPNAAPTLEATFDSLTAKAREKGTVKVIVGFHVEDYQPDAELRRSEQIEQRLSIKQKQTSLLNRLRSFEVINPKQFEFIPFMAMEISADALDVLRASGEITSIQEDRAQPPTLLQSVPLIGAPAAWSAGFTGQGRTVAILDSGVDRFHPFFNNRVVSEGCYSTASPNSVSVCPGGVSPSTAVNSGLNCDVNQIEGCSHGTHVAGIAAGGNPQINGAGVAKNANIIAMQVFSVFFGQDCGSNPSPCILSQDSDQIAALQRVYALRTNFNIDAVNMSLGGGQFFNYCDADNVSKKAAIDNLRSANIATVIASGNSGYTNSMGSPGCISTAISVGSTHDGSVAPVDTISDFSNSAVFLNLLAPGEQIQSSVPGGSYENSQGTSQAAPHVAGAWAVLKQKYPTDTVSQILTRLKYGGVQVTDSRNGLVKPRIKIDTALNTSNVDPCSSATGAISFGQTINGAFGSTDCIMVTGSRADVYTFTGTAGQGVAVALSSTQFFTYLYLVDQSGNIVAQNGNAFNSRIPTSGFLTLPSTGTYYIYATSVEGNRFGNYSLSLTTNQPTCSFTITSSSQSFGASGGAGSFNVNSATGCAWTAQSSQTWLTVTSGGSGSGGGTVGYSVAPNTSTTARTAAITTGGQVHTVTQAGANPPTNTRRQFDFDGDGKSDLSVFRPSSNIWYLQQSQNGFTGAQFGSSGDLIAPADYDGDGKTDIAVFRPSTGTWYLQRSALGFTGIQFGANGDIPMPADFDADGKADLAVFRPSSGVWYIQQSQNGFTGIQFGANGDRPVAADYDGDGKSDLAVFRSSTGVWYLQRSQLGFTGIQFGQTGDLPTPADFDGDGKADLAVFRSGTWYLQRSQLGFTGIQFGATGDRPTAADYDGDGKSDLAVFRPAGGAWYIQQSQNGFTGAQFGANGDQPVPAAYVP